MSSFEGEFHPDFQEVAELLGRQVAEGGEGGAAAAVYHRGEKVVDVWAGSKDATGTPWSEDTVAMSQSTTKGVAATALHLCAERGLVDLDAPVATYWPEFKAQDKGEIAVRHLLCHEAGLFPVRPLVEDALQLNDWEHMVNALAAAQAVHPPGAANGYHAFTFGYLVGEVVRRVTGRTVGTFVREEIAAPLGCDGLFIGLPESETDRRAELLIQQDMSSAIAALPPDSTDPAAEGEELRWSARHVRAALEPKGLGRWFASSETPKAEVPAANGCFTARSLARMYALWAEGGSLDGVTLFSPERVELAATVQNTREDLVLFLPIQWRLGFHPPFTAQGIINTGFGHFGFGGSGAWCDPASRLAVALTLNRVSGGGALGDTRMAEIGAAAVRSAMTRDA